MELYNDLHEKVCILSGIKATCITSTLKTGDKEITFEFRRTNRFASSIKEEVGLPRPSGDGAVPGPGG